MSQRLEYISCEQFHQQFSPFSDEETQFYKRKRNTLVRSFNTLQNKLSTGNIFYTYDVKVSAILFRKQ